MFKIYIIKTIKIALIFFVVVLFIRSFVIEPGRVNGVSMEPDFLDSNIFFVDKFSLLFRAPQRGQVVQMFVPELNEVVIKRIIGLPGEQITIKQNSIFITDLDGETFQLAEDYLLPGTLTRTENNHPYTYPVLKKDQYFLMGDNRDNSTDSRRFGAVSRKHIFGTVIRFGN